MSRTTLTAAQAAAMEDERRRWFALTPPEGVTVRFEVAPIVARFGAQLFDLLITGLATGAIMLIFLIPAIQIPELAAVVAFTLLLLIRAPYYIITELVWNGRTLGKRLMSIRAIGVDGRGLSTHAVVARNLMKEVEVFAPVTFLLAAEAMGWFWSLVTLAWIIILLIVPAVHPRRQRIGDILAGTVVTADPKPVLAPDLAAQRQGEEFVFTDHHLAHYGRFELQTLEEFLRAHPAEKIDAEPDAAVVEIAAQIRRKIGYEEPVEDARALAFLHAFYAAQRDYLERKRLYGDDRADKHHGGDSGGAEVE